MKIKKIYKSISIRAKVIITFIFLTAITFTVLGIVIFSNWFKSAHEVTSDLSKKTNEDIALQVSNFLNNPLELIDVHSNLISNNYVDMTDQEERERFFILALKNYDVQVYSFSFGTVNGEYYGARRNEDDVIEIMRNDASTGGYSWYYSINDDYTADERVVVAGLFDPRVRPWYTAAVELGDTVFSPIYQHFIMEDLAVSLATPIYNSEGTLLGVLGAHMILSNINTYLSDILLPNNGSSIIIDINSGELIANSMGLENYEILEDNTVHRVKIDEILDFNFNKAYQQYLLDQTESFEFRANSGYDYYSVVEVHENGVDWLIISTIPQGTLFARIIQNIYWMIAIFILSIVVLIIIYQVLIKKVFNPVDELIDVSNDYASGNFNRRMTVSGKDEFSKLAEAFNYMAEDINQIVNNLEQTVQQRTEHLRIANETLSESEQRFKILHNASFGGIAIHDKGLILDCNQGLSNLTGFTMDELIGMDGLQLIALDYREYVMEKIVSGFEKPYEAEGIRKNGATYPLKLEARNIPFKGKTIRVVEFRDITDQRDKEKEIKHISFHDELTGLYNRRFFDESLVRYDHPRNLPLTIVMGDMNNLKQLNDTYGHAVGDQYLKQAASIINTSARGTDIVTRWGGDEFVIIMPDADSDVAAKLVSRINARIDKMEFQYTQLSIAFGYHTKYNDDEDIQDTFRLAEKMMYKNKKTDGV